MKKFLKKYWKLGFGLVAIVFMAVYFMRGHQLENLVHAFERGMPALIAIALVFQMGKYFLQAESFVWCFKAAGAKLGYLTSVSLVFKTFFLDTVIPSFNISGTSIVVKEASKKGIEPGRSTGAALLRQISISAAFVVIMAVGFGVLQGMGKLETGWLILGVATTLGVGVLVLGLSLAALKPQWVLKIAAPVEKPVDKVLAYFHQKPIDVPLKNLVDTYSSSAKLMVHNKRDVLAELVFAVVANLCELVCFTCVMFAFGVNDPVGAICVYVVASVASLASPIPQGVGVVEAASLVAFALFGVEQATGMAIIMIYRVIGFWIPFLVGAVLMQGKSA